VIFTGGLFEQNSATYGGTFSIQSASLQLSGSTVVASQADYGGAVIVQESSRLIIDSNSFFSSSASINGGVMFVTGASSASLQNSCFVGSADLQGGVVFGSIKSTINAVSCDFTGNSSYEGGLVYVTDDARFNDIGSVFHDADSPQGSFKSLSFSRFISFCLFRWQHSHRVQGSRGSGRVVFCSIYRKPWWGHLCEWYLFQSHHRPDVLQRLERGLVFSPSFCPGIFLNVVFGRILVAVFTSRPSTVSAAQPSSPIRSFFVPFRT
jgi:hypothetical protein